MQSVEFHIHTRWRIKGKIEQVFDIISKPQDFVHWWSAVYLSVEEIESGDENGVGRRLKLLTKGLLPYKLNWRSKAIEVARPHRLVVEAQGDLEGRGEWRLSQTGEWVQIDYVWTVRINKAWMRSLAPLLRWVFVANHRWAMRQGLKGLKRELARLHPS